MLENIEMRVRPAEAVLLLITVTNVQIFMKDSGE
jgi:hypothetical protein